MTIAVLLLVLLAMGEAAARALRLTDAALYRPDPVVGYIPRPNQSGRDRARNRYAYNERSMGVAKTWRPGGVLLIGDSVVNGGWLDQSQRLGPTLARLTHREVWPVSAGGWSLLNELAWLSANPDVVAGSSAVVIVTNSEDFGEAAQFPPGLPQRRPLSALGTLLGEPVLRRLRRPPSPAPSGRCWRTELAALRNAATVLQVFYPKAGEAFAPDLPGLCVASDPRWAAATYRPDDPIHPDADGTALLARIIADQL